MGRFRLTRRSRCVGVSEPLSAACFTSILMWHWCVADVALPYFVRSESVAWITPWRPTPHSIRFSVVGPAGHPGVGPLRDRVLNSGTRQRERGQDLGPTFGSRGVPHLKSASFSPSCPPACGRQLCRDNRPTRRTVRVRDEPWHYRWLRPSRWNLSKLSPPREDRRCNNSTVGRT